MRICRPSSLFRRRCRSKEHHYASSPERQFSISLQKLEYLLGYSQHAPAVMMAGPMSPRFLPQHQFWLQSSVIDVVLCLRIKRNCWLTICGVYTILCLRIERNCWVVHCGGFFLSTVASSLFSVSASTGIVGSSSAAASFYPLRRLRYSLSPHQLELLARPLRP